MPESTSFDFPVRDTAVRMELASDISQSDTTLPVDQVVGFGDSDAPFLIKIWAPQSGEFREDFIEYAVVTSVDAANNSLDVRRDVENIGAVSASQGNLVQPMTLRASDIDEFGEKRLDKLKLAVDTGKAENVTSDSVDFVAEFLEFDPPFFDENSASVKFEYGETGNGFSNVFDPQRNPSTPKKISESLIVEFDGSEVSYSPLTQVSAFVNGVAIGGGYIAYGGGNDEETYVHNLLNGNLFNTLTDPFEYIEAVVIGEGYVAQGTDSGHVYVYDLSSGNLVYDLSETTSIKDVAIGDGYIAYTNDEMYLHNLSDGSLEYKISESSDTVHGVSIGEGYIAYGSSGGGDTNTYVHDLSNGNLVYTFTESSSNVLGVDIEGIVIGYVSVDENCYVHDLGDGSLEYTLTESSDSLNDIDINKRDIAYCGNDYNTYLHDLSDGSLKETFSKASEYVYDVSMNEGYVAYGEGGGGTFSDTYVHKAETGPLNPDTQYQYRAMAEADNAVKKGRTQTFITPSS